MKTYVHARLSKEDSGTLLELKRVTGQSESELVRRGLRLVREHVAQRSSTLDRAGKSVGRFATGPKDLSTSKKHLDGFGR